MYTYGGRTMFLELKMEMTAGSLTKMRAVRVLQCQCVLLGMVALGNIRSATASSGVAYFKPAAKHTVGFNERSLIIDGAPTLMLSGAVHYTRVSQYNAPHMRASVFSDAVATTRLPIDTSTFVPKPQDTALWQQTIC
jgi:hypothetical protein